MTVQSAALQLFLDGVWTSVPVSATPVTVERGTTPYSDSWPSPSSLSCELDNDSLNYDPANPAATIYGVAARNTLSRLTVNGTTGLTGEVAEWSPERTIDHVPGANRGRSVTGITAEGVLRRIGRWTDQIKSPMFQLYSTRSTSLGHWPLEDDRSASRLSNTLAGGRPAKLKGDFTLGESESPLGAASSFRMSASHKIDGTFAPASATAGWQIVFSFKLDAIPTTLANILYWRTTSGYSGVLQADGTSYTLVVIDDVGGFPVVNSVLFGAGREPTQWITMRVKMSQSGGTVTAAVAWYAEGLPNEVGFTSTFAGTMGALVSWGTGGSATLDGGWMSHVQGLTGGTDNLVGDDAQLVVNGYLGERTTTRFLRLCALRGITASVVGAEADGTPMGPQRPNTFVNLLKEIKETEDGRIDDSRSSIALVMATRRILLAQPPTLALTYPGHISYPFQRILDDQATANHVTASDALGSEVVATLATGPMSTQPPPAGVGEYRKTVEVSVADTTIGLADIANWHLAKGTIEKPRVSSVIVDLIANPGLAAGCVAVGLGSMITVTGFAPDVLQLLVTKVRERVTSGTWTFEFGVELYEPWNAGRWDAFRWDAKTSTVGVARTTTQTSFTFTTPSLDDVWSTSMTGVDLDIEGERVTVSAMGAASGSGPYTQTATVVRSVNGVVKAQKVGARVHLADAKRWGL